MCSLMLSDSSYHIYVAAIVNCDQLARTIRSRIPNPYCDATPHELADFYYQIGHGLTIFKFGPGV